MNTETKPIGCLAGKILRVDLSDGHIQTESSWEYGRRTLGGRATNSMILINEIAPQTKWNDPANILCFGAGSLAGTIAPGACRMDISTVNVFNGGKGSANVGGFFGPELKFAGYDHVVISGKSEKPVYLFIDNATVELRDAAFIWGKTTSETEHILRSRNGDRHLKLALIGPAGENRVKGSAVIIDASRAAGGSGVGCIMGDKKLKAIAVRGRGKIDVADPQRFMQAIEACRRQCATEPNVKIMRKSMTNFYSDPDFEGWDKIMCVRNGQDDFWEKEKRAKLMNRETGIPTFRHGMRACHACPTGCSSYMEINEGRYKGTKGEGFWVNTIMGLACRFDIADPDAVVHAWIQGNELGLDTDYMAAGLSWLFECFEKGLISKEDTEGLELNWGDGEALAEMVKKLAYRQGIGDLLADGLLEAAQTIGQGAETFAVHVKGQPSIEPFRIPKGWGLSVATSPVAGRHLRGSTLGGMRFGPRPRPVDFDAVNYKDQAKYSVWQARTKEIEDNLGICNYVGTWSGGNFMTPANFTALVNAGMGLDITEDQLMDHYAAIGRNLEKAFNSLHTDFNRKDDLPPKRYREEAVKSGPYKGLRADEDKYNEMLDEYYAFWGWDPETGLQTRSCLTKLDLDDLADKLASAGKLIES